MDVRELTPDLLPDWLAFFDGPAFADNRDWGTCYCRCFRFAGGVEAWDKACSDGSNRGAMSDLIARGDVWGALAYDGAAPVGWVQFGRRGEFRRAATREHPEDDTGDVGSIVCFVVAATHRRRGVARLLLRAAEGALARRGFAVAEAYPDRDEAEHRRMSGPLAMFLSEGFAPFREMKHGVVVRKALRP